MKPEQIKNRRRIVEMSYEAKTAHLGSALSATDIIEAVFSIKKPGDKFILSNGHAAVALYAVMERYGLIENPKIDKLGVHPDRNLKLGIEVSTGSLGQGLPIAVGMALADRNKNIYCCVSDGECAEGSIWEALRVAQEQRLDNLKVIVNANCFDAYEPVDLETLLARFQAQACTVLIVNGHSLEELTETLSLRIRNVPLVIFAKTNVEQLPVLSGLAAHYKILDENELGEALSYLARPVQEESSSIMITDEFSHLREIGTRFEVSNLAEQLRQLCDTLSDGTNNFHLPVWFDEKLSRVTRSHRNEWIVQGLDITSPEDGILVYELLTYFVGTDGSVVASKLLINSFSSEDSIEKIHQLSSNLAKNDPVGFKEEYKRISCIDEIGWLVKEMQCALVLKSARANGDKIFSFEHWGRMPEASKKTVHYFIATCRSYPNAMAGAEMRTGIVGSISYGENAMIGIIEALKENDLMNLTSRLGTNHLLAKIFVIDSVQLGDGFKLESRYDLGLYNKSYLISFKK